MRSSTHPFSIVLCTCNGARFLDAQLRSLRIQSGVAEIVAVDDASTDDTLELLRHHAEEDPRVTIHRNSARLGVNWNFERALRLARAPWIAISDQDDVWHPEKLARLRAAWDGRSGLVHHASRKFRGRPPASLPSPAGEGRKFDGDDVRRLLYRNSVVGHATVVRADLVRSVLPLPEGVPYDWWIGAAAAASGEVQYVDEFLVHYRIHENNAYHCAGSRWRRLRAEHDLRLKLLAALARWPQLPLAAKRFVLDYQRLLGDAGAVHGARLLLRFYRQHASLFFGAGRRVSWSTRWRKSLGATFGAWLHAPRPLPSARQLRPPPKSAPSAVEPWRRSA